VGSAGAAAAGAAAATAETLASRTAFAGRRIQVEVDRIRLPNGEEHDFEKIHHPGAAAVVPVLASGEVVMLRQYRHATGGWLLEIPAGTLDPGERPEECAARELREETGLEAEALQPLGWIWSSPGFTDERIWLYLAAALPTGRQTLERDEVLTLERLPFARAAAMAASGEIVDAKSVAALLRASASRARARKGTPGSRGAAGRSGRAGSRAAAR
jgi:ADP-ribose pyrophosphatase